MIQPHGIPNVIGLIDCTHVKIYSPGGLEAERFRNRKGYFSINVQCVGDFNLKILDLVASWPGSSHDSHIFDMSVVKVNRFIYLLNRMIYLLGTIFTDLLRDSFIHSVDWLINSVE